MVGNKQTGTSRRGETKKIEFEFIGLEMNNIGKSRCEEGNNVSQAQRSGPLLLVILKNQISSLVIVFNFVRNYHVS